jgi:hypothetical protein
MIYCASDAFGKYLRRLFVRCFFEETAQGDYSTDHQVKVKPNR